MKALIVREEFVGWRESADLNDPTCRNVSWIPGTGLCRYPAQKYAHVFQIDSNAREVQRHLKSIGIEAELVEWHDLVNS